MKGLLIKDMKLMLNQKKFFVTIGFIAVMMAGVVKDTSFIISYMTVLGAMLTISTISYDEFDNGNAFLFSLPVTRARYVLEKYGFGVIIGISCWLFSVLVAAATGEMRKIMPVRDTLLIAVEVLPVILILLAVIIPFQLKFGAEKGRIVSVAAIGAVVVVFIFTEKAAEIMNIDLDLAALIDHAAEWNWGMIAAAAMALALVLLLLSAKISIRIMEKKEF